jgi:hypothetical protein
MEQDVLERVLTIEEVKQRMKDIRTAALHYGGVVHAGERGRDEIVIVSTKTWEQVSARAAAPGAGSIPADPYGVFGRALAEGRLGTGSEVPEGRRRMRGLKQDNELSVTQMVAIAGPDTPSPRRRRAE